MFVTSTTPAFVSLFVLGAFHFLYRPTVVKTARCVVRCSVQVSHCRRLKADWWPLYLNYLIPDSVFAAIR